MTIPLPIEALRISLAALIGGGWISLATAAANLRGTRFGGTIGGLPSISSFSFLFIALNQSTPSRSRSRTRVPTRA